ncbi:MAG: class II glutamine amidotransferase [Ruminococcus sp.]|nr:class II glutamine amidotransferase [Ruminococcus sp.]MBR2284691.1 class II glutamine amidotransferase [Ruminococcus sp.]
MCALFGFLDYGHKLPVKILQKLLQALANASEVRGSHACGIAYNQGGQLTIYKRPKPAHKLRLRIPNGTSAVMGHTRFTTQGSEKQNYNNHPFRGTAGKAFALAHNGVLYNDSILRRERHLPSTKIETDSYIAVQLIEAERRLNFDSLRNMAEAVNGNFTFTVLDADNNLWFVKGDNPLYLIHFPELGLYLYSSTPDIMTAALKRSPLRWMHYEIIDAEEGDLLCIHPDGSIDRDAFRPMLYTPHYRWTRYDSCGWEEVGCTSEEDSVLQLLDICGYFGVTEGEVRRLLDLGYTYDEIEEFLFDPLMFHEAMMCGEI